MGARRAASVALDPEATRCRIADRSLRHARSRDGQRARRGRNVPRLGDRAGTARTIAADCTRAPARDRTRGGRIATAASRALVRGESSRPLARDRPRLRVGCGPVAASGAGVGSLSPGRRHVDRPRGLCARRRRRTPLVRGIHRRHDHAIRDVERAGKSRPAGRVWNRGHALRRLRDERTPMDRGRPALSVGGCGVHGGPHDRIRAPVRSIARDGLSPCRRDRSRGAVDNGLAAARALAGDGRACRVGRAAHGAGYEPTDDVGACRRADRRRGSGVAHSRRSHASRDSARAGATGAAAARRRLARRRRVATRLHSRRADGARRVGEGLRLCHGCGGRCVARLGRATSQRLAARCRRVRNGHLCGRGRAAASPAEWRGAHRRHRGAERGELRRERRLAEHLMDDASRSSGSRGRSWRRS